MQWEDQHEGLTCDQFAQWKTDNDPEAQKAGLAAILAENGIRKLEKRIERVYVPLEGEVSIAICTRGCGVKKRMIFL